MAIESICFGIVVSVCWQPQPRAVDSFCAVYRPITIPRAIVRRLPKEEAARLVRPILRENRKWKRLCAPHRVRKGRNFNLR